MATKRVLAVWWNDASSHDAWADTYTLLKFAASRVPCLTVGIEVSRDEHALHLAASRGVEEFGGIWKIPFCSIRRIKVIGRVELPTE